VTTTARQTRMPHTAQLEFDLFKPLPCGCVAAMYRTLDPGLCVVALEAKGPYCLVHDHIIGRVVAVPAKVTSDLVDDEDSLSDELREG
jgi:hypothetical protein